MAVAHKTVLLQESIDILELTKGETFVDGTIAGGGHSLEVCQRYGSDIKIVGIDVDPSALDRAREQFTKLDCEAVFFNGNFRNIDTILEGAGYESVDAILFDLGWSSDQFETSGRGFSFNRDEPLLMTLGDPSEYSLTARDLVNELDKDDLRTIIRNYGEERNAERIARAIVQARKEEPIETSGRLAEIIHTAIPKTKRIHPATKTFQALRIAVNDELEVLSEGIERAYEALAPGGRLAIISFHSLEDRIVKRAFKELSKQEGTTLITKKPIPASREEIEGNPRSRSAKLRAIKKIEID